MSLGSVATKAAGAAASSSSSTKSSVASAGTSVAKAASGVATTPAKTSAAPVNPSGPTGVAAIANAFGSGASTSSSSSSPAVVKTISAAGSAAAAGADKSSGTKTAAVSAAASSAVGSAAKTANAAAIDSYANNSASAGVGVWAAEKGGVDLALAARTAGAFAALGALAGVFWLGGTSPAGGDSEKDFEAWVNANLANTKASGTKSSTASPELPDDLVGTQDARAGTSGKRHISGPLDTKNGGTGNAAKDFEKLTGGRYRDAPANSGLPEGAKVGDNGIILRPGANGSGARIDIPAVGGKPHETLHY